MAGRYGEGGSGIGPWAWVGCGCCLGCLAIPVFFALVLGAGFFAVLRGTDVVDEALARATTHPELIEALGEPIERGWQVQGTFNVSDEGGEVDLVLPLSGPEGDATLYLEAEKIQGEWIYYRLEAEVEATGRVLDLRPPGTETAPEAPLG